MRERLPGGASGGTEVATIERSEVHPRVPEAPPEGWRPARWRGPSRWKRRIKRGLLAGVVLALVGGAVATVLVQRAGDDAPEAAATHSLQPSPPVRKAVAGMSLSRKVDAVMVAGLDAGLPGARLGGILVAPETWAGGGPAAIARVRKSAAGATVGPLVVGAQEGGTYRAYPDLPPAVNELEIGDAGDPALAERSARETGVALNRAGFDLNLAPVADVATIDSPIADRAYSDDPAVVASMVAAALRGCGAAGIACAPSHFPGLGGASADTALEPAAVSLDATSMRLRDLEPFTAAIAADAPAVVVSLAFYAAYDPVTPAALSPAVVTDLLRDELAYQGVAITDDLSSGAVAAIGAPAAAVRAVAAGSDMVLVSDPGQAAAAREALLGAARSGAVPAARLDEAVARVLTLKQRRGLFTG